MEKEFKKEYKCCPVCGSTERFFGSIVEELKGKGLLELNITQFNFQIMQGVLLPEEKVKALSFQDDLPGFLLVWDYCADCGCYYAVRIERKVIKKKPSFVVPNNIPINRAQRRRFERN